MQDVDESSFDILMMIGGGEEEEVMMRESTDKHIASIWDKFIPIQLAPFLDVNKGKYKIPI